MRYYDFQKAKEIIFKHEENLSEASLGMHEDWAWTAETVWENGKYVRELPENADALNKEYEGLREQGVSIFDDSMDKFNVILIGGIYGSNWATPTLELVFKDESIRMIPCHSDGTRELRSTPLMLGPISGPVQENITPLSEDI